MSEEATSVTSGCSLRPPGLSMNGSNNCSVVSRLKHYRARHVAEIGIHSGETSLPIASYLKSLGGETSLHLFDFDRNVQIVMKKIIAIGYRNAYPMGNSERLLDSYNWSLGKILDTGCRELFDYVYIDGSHTWGIDALAFFLVDLLLVPNGIIEFDDYEWSIASSVTLNPKACPEITAFYTDEQIASKHIMLIVERIVKHRRDYIELEKNRVFRKVSLGTLEVESHQNE